MRSKLRRIARLETKIEPYFQKQKEKAQRADQLLDRAARYHAIRLAVLVLHGKPDLKERLEVAWERCLIKFPGECFVNSRIADIVSGRMETVLEELPGETEKQKFQHVFDIAPHWLLRFTFAALTAQILKLQCPNLSDAPRAGLRALREGLKWPKFPNGTLEAGGGPLDPIDERELREVHYETLAKWIDNARLDCIKRGEMPDWSSDSRALAEEFLRDLAPRTFKLGPDRPPVFTNKLHMQLFANHFGDSTK
jgi:hypothetical protein